jgi:hypothetical protein
MIEIIAGDPVLLWLVRAALGSAAITCVFWSLRWAYRLGGELRDRR